MTKGRALPCRDSAPGGGRFTLRRAMAPLSLAGLLALSACGGVAELVEIAPPCQPGVGRCVGDAVQVCDERGTWSAALLSCPADRPMCASGVCLAASCQTCGVISTSPSGQTSTIFTDYMCDGRILSCTTLTTSSDGSTRVEENDGDCDGVPEYCEVVRVHGDEWTLYHDNGCDGIWDGCWTSRYDADEHLAWADIDDDCDGTVDGTAERVCQERIKDGATTLIANDVDCDGVPEFCDRRGYNAAGQLVSIRHETECDGQATSCASWRYDGAGRLVEQLEDQGCDGIPESCKRAVEQ